MTLTMLHLSHHPEGCAEGSHAALLGAEVRLPAHLLAEVHRVAAVPSLGREGFMGLAVALFILWSGIGLAKDTVSPLLGEGADPELREKIVDKLRENPKVLGFHDLMVHDYGPGQRFASIHVEMDRREDPMECHEIIDDLERECLKSHGVHLVIHYDPVVTDDPELDRMHVRVEQILHKVDLRLGVHDFRMVPGKGHVNLIFDIVLPTDLRGQEEKIQNLLEEELNQEGGLRYYPVITYDQSSFN